MIYYVTNQTELKINDDYEIITAEKSIEIINSWKRYQFDTETNGLDCRINKLLCIQFGNKKANIQIVVDVTTIDIQLYKNVLEKIPMIGQNLKFDVKMLFSVGIVPTKMYDTMLAEQLIFLGYPKGMHKASLDALAKRYLNIKVSKTIRGQIASRGLDHDVIIYAAKDVEYLEDIMDLQLKILKKRGELKAIRIECAFIPAVSYFEWCGVKLDVERWSAKMLEDKKVLNKAQSKIDYLIIQNKDMAKYVSTDTQGDLFSGEFNTEPYCNINWQSSPQVIKAFIDLGFKCRDSKGKATCDAKVLATEKGVNDVFLNAYLEYAKAAKVCSTYGQTYLDAINPLTGRIHTTFRSLGTDSGRLACGSTNNNLDLVNLKKKMFGARSISKCIYPQLQTLPANAETRAAFISEDGNKWISADYKAQESRAMAVVANEKSMIEEYKHGSGDIHSLTAKMLFPELKDVAVKDVKKLFPNLRKAAKPVEFLCNYGGNDFTLKTEKGFTELKAKTLYNGYMNGFPGLKEYQDKQRKFIANNGYILICPQTGHRATWWDFDAWKSFNNRMDRTFWDEYRQAKELGDWSNPIIKDVRTHFKARSKWEKASINYRIQGSCAVAYKVFCIDLFNWVIANNLFGIVKFLIPVHDEINVEAPDELTDKVAEVIATKMEEACAIYFPGLPIPADVEIEHHWVH